MMHALDAGQLAEAVLDGAGPGCSSADAHGFAVSKPNSDQKSGAILQAALHDVFSELRQARIAYCWAAMVDITRDPPSRPTSALRGVCRWSASTTG